MATYTISVDSDQIKEISKTFAEQSAIIADIQRALIEKMAPLENGDFKGQTANAFFADMHDQILPALKQLKDNFDLYSQQGHSIAGRIEEQIAAVLAKCVIS